MARTDKSKKLEVVGTIVVAPEHKGAFLAEFHDPEGEKLGERWLPYSQVTYKHPNGAGGFTVKGIERGEQLTLEIPEWLTETPDLEPLIREQLLDQEAVADEMLEDDREGLLDGDLYDKGDDDIPF